MSPRPKTAAADDIANDVRVRPTSLFDIPLIAALHADSFTGILAGQVWDEAAVAGVLAMPGAYGLLAVPGKTISPADKLTVGDTGPAGFLLGCNVPNSEPGSGAGSGEILSLGTVRTWRRRGVARTLLRAMVTRAEATGISRLFLEVAEDNIAARDLYIDAGFARIARRPAYYRRPDGPAIAALVLAYDLA